MRKQRKCASGEKATRFPEPAQETKEQKVVDTITVCSPMSGLAADLSTAPDEAFAEKMMGDGAVVTPEDPYVRAPEDGEVAFVFDTKHDWICNRFRGQPSDSCRN